MFKKDYRVNVGHRHTRVNKKKYKPKGQSTILVPVYNGELKEKKLIKTRKSEISQMNYQRRDHIKEVGKLFTSANSVCFREVVLVLIRTSVSRPDYYMRSLTVNSLSL